MSDPYTPTLVHPRPPIGIPVEVTKVLSSTNPEQVTNQSRKFTRATAIGNKGNNSANGAAVYLGNEGSYQEIEILAGKTVVLEPGINGWPDDLSRYKLRGASGDGVVIKFTEGVENS